jgi:hypothetical protein
MELPVVIVTFDSVDGCDHKLKPLRFTAYNVDAMFERLRASRLVIRKFTEREHVCYPAGETDSWDDVIEQLLVLRYMIDQCGLPFQPLLFKQLWGELPYTLDHRARDIIKGKLSS